MSTNILFTENSQRKEASDVHFERIIIHILMKTYIFIWRLTIKSQS